VVFCNTLVDRIVPGVVAPSETERLGRELGYSDGLLTACEPYALFAIEGDAALRDRLQFPGADPRIIVAPDIRPYRERKVRVLNGAHTIMVPAALLAGLETVREACEDERIGRFLRRVVFDEIVPSVDAPGAEAFAGEVIERFNNPYTRHALIDIMLFATTKLRVRVVPSIIGYHARMGRSPSSLAFGFAAYLEFMRAAAGLAVPDDADGERVRAAWNWVDVQADESIIALAKSVCANEPLWGADLSRVNGFADAVGEHLVRIVRQGVAAALDVHLTEPATT
jgi:tagaturonate reductase